MAYFNLRIIDIVWSIIDRTNDKDIVIDSTIDAIVQM